MKIDPTHPLKPYLTDAEIRKLHKLEDKLYLNGILLLTVVLNIPVTDGRDSTGDTPAEG